MFSTPVLVSLITPAGDGQLLPSRTTDLLATWLDPASGVVGLVGELDSSNSASARKALEGQIQQAEDLILNLAELDFIDCSGVRLLIFLANRLEEAGGRLVLVSPHRVVRRVITLTKVDEHPKISIEDGDAGRSGGFERRQGVVRLT
ncbi:MAG TPA: STAS domain-containing protein [Actinomycetota bacterium]|nr:STAS domain-containing protein [Actinomycetota bacterium]